MTYEIGSVGPSVLLSALSSVSPGVFLELKVFSWNFLKFGMVPETHLKLCITEPNFLEKLYAPKMGKKGFFLKLLVNLVFHFFLICPTICSVVKLYPIICVPAQIPYLGKIWFPKYGLK